MDLSTKLVDAGRSFKMYAGRLEKLGISTLHDLLFHIPHRYEDFSVVAKIATIQPGEIITIQGTVVSIKNVYTKHFKKIQEAEVSDDTGTMHVMWFNQPFIVKSINHGDTISLAGRVEKNNNKLTLMSPDYEIISSDTYQTIHTGRLVPIYPETKGVSSKWLRRQIFALLSQNADIQDTLPEEIIREEKLMELFPALMQVHFPDNLKLVIEAKERLAFDELFFILLAGMERKQAWQQNKKGNAFTLKPFATQIEKLWNHIPFELTFAQKKALDHIFADLEKKEPMNRLLQGDVGSGKTVVAAVAMYLSFLNGYQSVLMAPTEILANQHFQTIKNFLEPLGVRIAIATGSKKTHLTAKGTIPNDLASSKNAERGFDILIGTHAVLNAEFHRLGLVVIDEQQRFGVEQRTFIREKGSNPHLLTMTATPIPRTVALTLYGDLDLSVLDEMPKGRKQIKTWLVPNTKRQGAYTWIEKQVKTGDQIFVVCPFIEASESLSTVRAATQEFERLQKVVFPHLRLAMLHGKLKPKEKDTILEDFKNKKYDILVATPVVEVGIDIPNATVIVIEAAERFGLAQLHQMRGRVGRGDKQSYCLLFSESQSDATRSRLASLQTIHIGSELAELDLKLRGAGELYGTAQSGRANLKIASFGDLATIEKAKKQAQKIFPKITEFPLLFKKLREINLEHVNPD